MIRIAATALLFAAAPAFAQAQDAEELKRIIRERDAQIHELNRRIEALEKNPASPADDDEEMNRALERTLVQQGGSLLRRGAYELEPQLSYSRWDKTRSAFRHTEEGALSFRAGLGWDSQLQVRAPYVHASTNGGSAAALGDIDLSVSKQLARQDKLLPSLVGSVAWVSRTGKDGLHGEVPTGGGFDVLQAGLTTLRRQDPLVYYGGLSYASPISRNIEGMHIRAGDTVGLRLGGILAASPEASVLLGLNLGFVKAARINDQPVPESDTVLGTLQIGFASIVTQKVMVNVTTEVRVTGNVPDLRLTVALPVRF